MQVAHKFLRASGMDPDAMISAKPQSTKLYSQTHTATFQPCRTVPKSHAANYVSNGTQGPPDLEPQAKAASMSIGTLPID